MLKSKHVLTALYLWAVMLPIQAATADTLETVADTTHYINQGLVFLDWRMTRDCLKRPDCVESNPRTRKLIDSDDIKKLDIICGLQLVGNEVIQRYASTKFRVGYNLVSIGLRYDAVKHHFEIGLKVDL